MKKKKILILGAGFVGVYTFLKLHKFWHGTEELEISIVNNNNYFLFVPMIHEVATGNLAPESVIQPIRQIFSCCMTEFIEGRVEEINLDRKSVRIVLENGEIVREYDYLVVGLGSDINYFSVPGAREYTIGLKSLSDAIKIKNHIIESFEKVSVLNSVEDIQKYLNFVIVGGGPTGVELAGEVCDLIRDEMKESYPKFADKAKVYLISAGGLLDKIDNWCGEQAYRLLRKLDTEVITGKRVMKVTQDGVEVEDLGFIESVNVFWAGGVKAVDVNIKSQQLLDKDDVSGRIKVLDTLQIPQYPEVFVGGDMMWLKDKEKGQPYPMRAQFAVREGELIGENITRDLQGKKLKNFNWHDKGFIVSVGKGNAFAYIGRIKFTGHVAWWMYRTAYLFKLVGLRAKLKTAFEWTLNLFLPRDISKIK